MVCECINCTADDFLIYWKKTAHKTVGSVHDTEDINAMQNDRNINWKGKLTVLTVYLGMWWIQDPV